MNTNTHVRYYVLLSIIAGFLLTIIISFEMSITSEIKTFYEKMILNSGFILACIFGLSCAWFPGWYQIIKKKGEKKVKHKVSLNYKRRREGHHPDCQKFQTHRITIKNKSYCAGCLGLSIGFGIAIILSFFYIIYSSIYLVTSLIVGYICSLIVIGLVYIETIYNTNKTIHILSNILLIVSVFFLIFTVYELTEEIQYGFIAMLFSFLFMETRIHLSKRKHKKICAVCANKCKMY